MARSTKRNSHRPRKGRNFSALNLVVADVPDKAAQAVGPAKVGPVKAGPVKAGPADVVVKADAAAFVPRLIR